MLKLKDTEFLTLVPDYENLDAYVAAEVALHAKAKQTALLTGQPPPAFPSMTAPNAGYPAATPSAYSSSPQQPMQRPGPPTAAAGAALSGQPPNLSNLITSLDGPSLQKLLSAMQQSPHGGSAGPGSAQSPAGAPDLSALLSSINKSPSAGPTQQSPYGQQPQPGYGYSAGHQPSMVPPQQHPQHQQQPQQYGGYAQGMYAQSGGQPPMGGYQQQQGQGPQPTPEQVQSIMARLAARKPGT